MKWRKCFISFHPARDFKFISDFISRLSPLWWVLGNIGLFKQYSYICEIININLQFQILFQMFTFKDVWGGSMYSVTRWKYLKFYLFFPSQAGSKARIIGTSDTLAFPHCNLFCFIEISWVIFFPWAIFLLLNFAS